VPTENKADAKPIDTCPKSVLEAAVASAFECVNNNGTLIDCASAACSDNDDTTDCTKQACELCTNSGTCHSTCKSEQGMAVGMQIGDQCWSCVNDFCEAGDPNLGADADSNVATTVVNNVLAAQLASAIETVNNEEDTEAKLDRERADAERKSVH
jgi:hypothetical protein